MNGHEVQRAVRAAGVRERVGAVVRAIVRVAGWAGVLMSWAVQACGVRVLVDHVGYEAGASKGFVVEGAEADRPKGWELREHGTGRVVERVGKVDRWRFAARDGGRRREFWTGDLSAMRAVGEYDPEVGTEDGGHAAACTFAVEWDVLERRALSNVVFFD